MKIMSILDYGRIYIWKIGQVTTLNGRAHGEALRVLPYRNTKGKILALLLVLK
jgi:hypothetical protein